MSIRPMDDILGQIKIQGKQTQTLPSIDTFSLNRNETRSLQFSDILSSSINNINQMQTHARGQAEKYLTGAPDIGLNDVMVSLQKSSLALNLGVQVRNKVVSSWQEIMNMSV